VWCWGRNESGELGDGTQTQRTNAVRVAGLSDVRQVSVGNGFSCALRGNGTIVCWGSDREGQLGSGAPLSDGTTKPIHTTPVEVAGLANAVEIASGADHSCARIPGGEVRCWGQGRGLALGDGVGQSSSTPVPAIGVSDATQLAAGMSFSCALRADGRVMCWGSNSYGEVGNGSEVGVLRPVVVESLRDVVEISASSFNPCAQVRDGRVFCWGNNEYGMIAVGAREVAVREPAEVQGVPCHATLMPGSRCMVASNGRVWCWGTYLGDGRMTVASAVTRTSIEGVVAAGGSRSLFAIDATGSVSAWGYNDFGQLGDGTTVDRWTPVRIELSVAAK
jgi:alpha-tubulin suppressor-like RCC1 family protein